MCISYINRLKSAPKAPKILGNFGLLIRKPPLVLAAFGTRGGVIRITTDLIPKLSNVELLTPPHTLLVTVYVSSIFTKIRKIPKIRESVQIVT